MSWNSSHLKLWGLSTFVALPGFYWGITNLEQIAGKVPHVYFDWILGFFCALLIGALLTRFRQDAWVHALWGLHAGCSLGYMIGYEARYPLDAFDFFLAENTQFYFPAFMHGNDNFAFFLGYGKAVIPSYHAWKLILSSMGMWGTLYLVQSLNMRRWMALLILPSIFWWNSILGKDPIVYMAICILLVGLVNMAERRPVEIPMMCLSVALLALFRVWLIPVMILPILILPSTYRGPGRWLLLSSFMIFATYLIVGLELYSEQQILDRFNAVVNSWNRGGSAQEIFEFGSLWAIIQFLPESAFSSLFRPLPGDVAGYFGLAAGLESLSVMAIVAVSIWFTILKRRRDMAVCLLLLLSWSILVGWISYQNLGTGVRFRLQALPMVLLLAIRVIDYWGGVDRKPGSIHL